MQLPIFIYFLSDKRTPKDYRYVGQSNALKSRIREHYLEALSKDRKRKCNCWKCNWVRKVYSEGSEIIYDVIEECQTDKEANIAEEYWIPMMRYWGFQLVNNTIGGKGSRGRKKPFTEEHKKKLSEWAKKRVYEPWMIEKLKNNLSKIVFPENHAQLCKDVALRYWNSEKGRKRAKEMGTKRKGMKQSKEHIQKRLNTKQLKYELNLQIGFA